MTWKVEQLPWGSYRYNLQYWGRNRYSKDPNAPEMHQSTLAYQGWAMGGCSTAQIWAWNQLGKHVCTKENLVGLIDVIQRVAAASMYDPKMFFCQIPEEGREGFQAPMFKFLVAEVFGELEPVYTYENRAHASTLQRLYYVDTVPLYEYARKYHAEQDQIRKQAAAAERSNGGTIIKPRPEQDAMGVRYDQYFDAGEGAKAAG